MRPDPSRARRVLQVAKQDLVKRTGPESGQNQIIPFNALFG